MQFRVAVLGFFCAFQLSSVAGQSKSVTVNGMASGSYTFQTIFSPKACSALTVSDLAHLTQSEVNTITSTFNTKLNSGAQCIVVFGIVVVCDIPNNGNFVRNNWIHLFANTIAIILDKNKDGVVDDTAVGNLMKTKPNTGSYIIGTSISLNVLPTVDAIIGSTTPLTQQQDFQASFSVGESMRAMTEEIFHTYQKFLGVAYPTIFGTLDTQCTARRLRSINATSTSNSRSSRRLNQCPTQNTGCNYQQSLLTKCSFLAFCNWYTQMLCCSQKGAGASGTHITAGSCVKPSCGSIEWYYNLLFQYSETIYPGTPQITGSGPNDPGADNGGANFPATKAAVKQKLTSVGGNCALFLTAMENPVYNQPLNPFDWNYVPAAGAGAGAGASNSTSSTSTVTTSSTSTVTTGLTTTPGAGAGAGASNSTSSTSTVAPGPTVIPAATNSGQAAHVGTSLMALMMHLTLIGTP